MKYSFQKKKKLFGTPLFCTLDTETRGFGGDIFALGFYDGVRYKSFKSVIEWVDYVEENYKHNALHIYCHNLDFDFSKIFDTIKRKYKVNFSNSLFINNSVKTLFVDRFCIFHDSASLLGFSSLEKLSEDFELGRYGKYDLEEYIKEKGYAVYDNGEYNKSESSKNFFMNVHFDDEVLQYYLEMDCKSLYKILKILCNILDMDDNDLFNIPTTASLALRYFKRHYKKQYEKATSYTYRTKEDIALEDWMRNAYHGGRTEVFTVRCKDGFHYDVTSLFPSRMKFDKYPCGHPSVYEGIMANSIYKIYKKKHTFEGFIECDIDIPKMYLPPLPYVWKNKLTFPYGKLHGVWTLREIEYAEKLGGKIEKIYKVVTFEYLEDLFSEYVDKFFNIKNTSKGAKKFVAKLLLNTLYGKFGMKRERETYVALKYLEELEENSVPFTVYKMELGKVLKAIISLDSPYIQVPISSHVTAYSRIYLHEQLQRQLDKGANIYYCDTDSGVTDQEMEYNVGKHLGGWDLENIIVDGIYIQPKLYFEETVEGKEDVIKGKGIPNDIRKNYTKETYLDFLRMINNGEERIELFQGVEKPKKFLSKLKNREKMNTLLEMRKGINLQNEQKRKIDYVTGESEAWEILEYRNTLSGVDPDYIFSYNNRDNTEVTFIKDIIKQIGKIKIPKEKDEGYKLYHSFCQKHKEKTIKLFFKDKGKLSIFDFIFITELSVECINDIMSECDIYL